MKNPSKLLIAAFALLACCSVTRAQVQDNDGCSDATLKGDYAFTVSGQILIPGIPAVQRLGVAMTHFDGAGHLTQVDYVISSPGAPAPPGYPPTNDLGFQINETGTYSVRSDCTGTFTINFPELTDPTTGKITPGAVITTKFVLSNGGRSIHTVVSSLTPPGAKGPVPALITSEGHKLYAFL